jgi:hypothetical protein
MDARNHGRKKKIADADLTIFRLVDDPETIIRIVMNFNSNEQFIS